MCSMNILLVCNVKLKKIIKGTNSLKLHSTTKISIHTWRLGIISIAVKEVGMCTRHHRQHPKIILSTADNYIPHTKSNTGNMLLKLLKQVNSKILELLQITWWIYANMICYNVAYGRIMCTALVQSVILSY